MLHVCFVCGKELYSYRNLKRHVKVFHLNYKGSCVCKHQGCVRECSNVQSMFKHILTCHSVKNNAAPSTCYSNIPISTASTSSDQNKKFCNDQNIRQTEHVIFDSSNDFTLVKNDLVDASELLNDLKVSEFNFISLLYCKPHLTRKDVNDIIVNSSFLSKSIQEYHDLTNQNFKCFENLETEHKRLSFFKDMGS